MSTADNRICLECKYANYTAKQCFSTGLCLKAVDKLQAKNKAHAERIKELEEESRWIPVTERLPKDGGLYLLTKDFDKGEDLWMDIYGSGSSGFKSIVDYIHLHNITHWKPIILPEQALKGE